MRVAIWLSLKDCAQSSHHWHHKQNKQYSQYMADEGLQDYYLQGHRKILEALFSGNHTI